MKAVRFHGFGGPEVLRYEDVERPTPGPGQVRLRVAATSFNDIDSSIRAGDMRDRAPVRLPHVPGVDVAGTVEALGPGVEDVAVGDRVVGLLPMTASGAAADHVLVPVEVLAGAPTRLRLTDLAALPLVGLTAWQALFEHGGLTGGQRVLVHGADSAAGGCAVQLARGARAQVIATAGPAVGGGEVLDRPGIGVTAAMCGPVDLVLNLAAATPERLTALVALVRTGGVLVNTAVRVPAPSDVSRGVRGIDFSVRSDADQLADLIARVSTGELVVDVAQRVPLADLPTLHARGAAGRRPGKVVVLPTGG